MKRIDVHGHFLPALDDGCRDLAESLQCLRMMAAAGYDRVFCTPHCGASDFSDLTCAAIADQVRRFAPAIAAAGIPIEIFPGGDLRLTPLRAEDLPRVGVPTFGHAGKYVLADLWEPTWPAWASRAVEWLQKRDYTVIIAHPERMPVLRHKPAKIDEIARLGVLFQGNLSPLGGGESDDINALGERYLKEGRYFMLGSDAHRPSHMEPRLAGLRRAAEWVGQETLDELTITHPLQLFAEKSDTP